MKLSTLPELNKSITDKDLYREREKNLLENIQEIKNASEYFAHIRTTIDNNHTNYKIYIQNIYTKYKYWSYTYIEWMYKICRK